MSGVRKDKTNLEDEILAILRRVESIGLSDLYRMLKARNPRLVKSEESLRKALERMELKGLVRNLGRGRYAKPRDLLSYLEKPRLESLLSDIEIEITKFGIDTRIKAGWELRQHLQKAGIPITSIRELKGSYVIGGAAGDESSRHIRPFAKMYTGSIVTVTARVRLGGVLPYIASIEGPRAMPSISTDDPHYIPDHINRGGTIELLVKKFREPFVGVPKKLEGVSVELASELARKYDEYAIEELKVELIMLSLNEARYKRSSSDFSIALIDGSILPGHLDPHIAPGTRKYIEIEKEAPDIAKDLLKTKERILRNYWTLYAQAHHSKNLILVGAIKSSEDITLQSTVAQTYYGYTDQEVLASGGLKEGEVLGPFKKHRLREWVGQITEMEIEDLPKEEPPIESYYIEKFPHGKPLQLDIVFPETFSQDDRMSVLSVLYTMIEGSDRHKELQGTPTLVPTLMPLKLIDDLVSKKSREITNIVEREVEAVLQEIFGRLAELAYRYGIDFALYTYSAYVRDLRRVS